MVNAQLQDNDFEWFLKRYEDLFKEYGNAYLAIKNEKVLGSYKSYGEAVEETKKTEELGTFIVQHCNGREDGYTNYIASMNFMGAAG